jgi:GMC oxidoreductase
MKQTNCSIHGHECHQGLFARNLYLGQKIPLAGVAHQNGTIRFGNDSTSSALDRNCKAHEIDNLYVVDASFFPSSGAVNPALTIMANALRVGDHLKRRLGVRDSSAKRTTEAVPEVVVVTSGVRRLLRETLIDPQKPGMLSGNSRLISESEIDVPLSSITPPISNDGSNA